MRGNIGNGSPTGVVELDVDDNDGGGSPTGVSDFGDNLSTTGNEDEFGVDVDEYLKFAQEAQDAPFLSLLPLAAPTELFVTDKYAKEKTPDAKADVVAVTSKAPETDEERAANVGNEYSDHEILITNKARNALEGLSYLIVANQKTGLEEITGILIKSEDGLNVNLARSDIGEITRDLKLSSTSPYKVVIEVPACSLRDSPIGPRIMEHLKHLSALREAIGDNNCFPLEILFPYNKESIWHWNLGKITINKNEEGKFEINGYAIDSYGRGVLEEDIQAEILSALLSNGFLDENSEFKLDHETIVEAVQTNVACGLYAGIAMHNSKFGNVFGKDIWGDVFGIAPSTRGLIIAPDALGKKVRLKSEEVLRREAFDLVRNFYPEDLAGFCRPARALSGDKLKLFEQFSDSSNFREAYQFFDNFLSTSSRDSLLLLTKSLSNLDESGKRGEVLVLQ